MSKLPLVSGRDCIKALQRAGYVVMRQKGSHVILRRDDPYGKVVVPITDEIPKGTLRAIIRDSGLTVDEFIELLQA
jgi:predicted RNA binding protein YcfA (HicA-like mRNA interferase family)